MQTYMNDYLSTQNLLLETYMSCVRTNLKTLNPFSVIKNFSSSLTRTPKDIVDKHYLRYGTLGEFSQNTIFNS